MNKVLLKHKFLICTFILCTCFSGSIGVSFAYIIQQFIVSVQTKSIIDFKYSSALFFCFILLSFLINRTQVVLQADIQKKIHLDIKNRLMNYCLHMDFEDQINISLGEKINYFEYYISVYEEYFLESIMTIISAVFILIPSMLYLLKINIIIACSIIILGILSLFLPIIFGNIINNLVIQNAKYNSDYLTKIKEIITGTNIIKIFNVKKFFFNDFNNCLINVEDSTKKLKVKNAELNQLSVSFQYMVIIICLILSGWNVLRGKLTLGELIALTQISNMVIDPIQQLGNSIIDIIGSKDIRNKVESMIDSPIAIQNLENFDETIVNIVLNNISLSLNDGKKF